MPYLYVLGYLILSYLAGSIPFGLLIVKLKTGQDIRKIESGRTGGTNVMRATSFWYGILTGALDITKAGLAALIARWIFPGQPWVHVLAPVMAVIGHNYSIFMIERLENGRICLRGGAGGAPTIGGSVGLWFPSLFISLPFILIIWLGIGYASLATLSTGVISVIIFGVRAYMKLSPWQYVFFGIFSEILLIWALRPNIKRLFNGTERVVGWRARKKKNESQNSNDKPETNLT